MKEIGNKYVEVITHGWWQSWKEWNVGRRTFVWQE